MGGKAYRANLDLRSSGAILRILVLIAMADGVLAPEETSMLDRAYLKQCELEKLESGVSEPNGPLTAKLAYMVISASREDYGFPVNSAERQAFDQLTQTLELTDLQKDQAIQEATRELARQPGFWEILMNAFSNQFMLDTDPNPIA